jgi:hypothetical protein
VWSSEQVTRVAGAEEEGEATNLRPFTEEPGWARKL